MKTNYSPNRQSRPDGSHQVVSCSGATNRTIARKGFSHTSREVGERTIIQQKEDDDNE